MRLLTESFAAAESIPTILAILREEFGFEDWDIPSSRYFQGLRNGIQAYCNEHTLGFIGDAKHYNLWIDGSPTRLGHKIYAFGLCDHQGVDHVIDILRVEQSGEVSHGGKGKLVGQKIMSRITELFEGDEGKICEFYRKVRAVSSDCSKEQESMNSFLLEEMERIAPVVPIRYHQPCFMHC